MEERRGRRRGRGKRIARLICWRRFWRGIFTSESVKMALRRYNWSLIGP